MLQMLKKVWKKPAYEIFNKVKISCLSSHKSIKRAPEWSTHTNGPPVIFTVTQFTCTDYKLRQIFNWGYCRSIRPNNICCSEQRLKRLNGPKITTSAHWWVSRWPEVFDHSMKYKTWSVIRHDTWLDMIRACTCIHKEDSINGQSSLP